MVLKTSLACGLQECIGNLWKDEESGDFTVVVEGTPFLCHRLILSACSSFFQGLFRSEMKEAHGNRTIISGMTKDTLEVILTSVYMGTDGLTTDNILNIWPATVQLQIKYLIKECEDFVMQNISVDNCFSILYHAHLLSCKQVVDYSLDFMAKHFEDICNTEGVLQLSFDDFYKIVTSDKLTSSSEEVVVKTILKWVEYTDNQFYNDEVSASSLDNHNMDICDVNNQQTESLVIEEKTEAEDTLVIKTNNGNEISGIACENLAKSEGTNNDHGGDLNISDNMEEIKSVMDVSGKRHEKVCSQCSRRTDSIEINDRMKHLYTLISGCRVHLLDLSFNQQLVKNHKLMSLCEKTFNLLLDSLIHKMSLGSQHLSRSDAVVTRSSPTLKHVMVFATRGCVMAYVLDNGSIDQYVKFPADYFSHSSGGITCCNNMLYMLYTNIEKHSVLSMYTNEQQWKQLCCLRKDSNFSCLMSHDNCIYRYSYYNNFYNFSHNNDRYFLEYCHHNPDSTTEWIVCSELKSDAIFFTGFKHYILCFHRNGSSEVDYYDTQKKEMSTCVTPLSGSDTGMISFTHQGDVFILQENGYLWKITSSDTKPVDLQQISKLWTCPVHLCGGVIYREQLFVFYRQTETIAYIRQASLPGLFESSKMIEIDSETNCWPMILH